MRYDRAKRGRFGPRLPTACSEGSPPAESPLELLAAQISLNLPSLYFRQPFGKTQTQYIIVVSAYPLLCHILRFLRIPIREAYFLLFTLLLFISGLEEIKTQTEFSTPSWAEMSLRILI